MSFKSRAVDLADTAYHSTRFFWYSLVMMGMGVSVFGLWRAGAFDAISINGQSVLPPSRPPLPAPGPETPKQPEKPLEAVTIALHGPQPAMALVGVSTTLTADTTGPSGIPKWRIIPGDAGTLRVTASDGRRAELLALQEGRLAVFVDVAGDGRQIANDSIEVDIVSASRSEDRPQHDVPPPAPQPAQPQPMQPQAQSVTQLATAALAQIDSDNRAQEAVKVASCFSMVIARIQAVKLPPDADPMFEIETQVNSSLGANAGRWHGFLSSMSIVLEQLRQQGSISTVATTVPALAEMAAVLRQSK